MINIIDYEIIKEIEKLDKYLYENRYRDIVLFCAGNYKIWYDCFAPNFAEKLRLKNVNLYIYGGKEYPITADNIISYMDFIEQNHPNACIIVVDNVLSVSNDYGLTIKKNSTIPAGIINQQPFGDISILFRTNYLGDYNLCFSVQNKIETKLIDYFIKFA